MKVFAGFELINGDIVESHDDVYNVHHEQPYTEEDEEIMDEWMCLLDLADSHEFVSGLGLPEHDGSEFDTNRWWFYNADTTKDQFHAMNGCSFECMRETARRVHQMVVEPIMEGKI